MSDRQRARQEVRRNWWRRAGSVLHLTRFSSLIVVTVFLLLGVGQGRDILISLAEGSLLRAQLFFLPVLWSAFAAWYFARILLDFEFPGQPAWRDTAGDWWQRHLPRLLGTAIFLAIAIQSLLTRSAAAPESRRRVALLAVMAAIWGLLFYLVTTFRRPLLGAIRPFLERRAAAGSRLAELLLRWTYIPDPETDLPYHNLADLRRISPITFRLVMFALLMFVLVVLAASMHPVLVGTVTSPITLLFLFAGVWIPLGSCLVYWSSHSGAPVLTGVLLLALLFSFWNDNHALRRPDDGGDLGVRPAVTEALRSWHAAQGDPPGSAPFVLVATAGGGSRAAYWTATVLGALEDEIPGFHRRLFAISGVSGGSVGAVTYRAVLADHLAAGAGPDSACSAASGGLRECGQRVIGGNFLGPALAAALYPDLLQRFLPLPQAIALPDRAAALEMGWEKAYRKAMGTDRFARSLLDLFDGQTAQGGNSWPALFLNGTWVQTGRRLVTSNIDLGADRTFLTAHDLLSMLGRDVPLSTAADNSARFPIVGPGGTMRRDGAIVGRVVDGGYFENYGAVTALEVLRTAVATLPGIRPLVIQISSDPTLPEDPTLAPEPESLRFAYEIRTPVQTFLATRGARGRLAFAELRSAAEESGEFFHLRFCRDDGRSDPPLGWMLSEAARDRIDGYLPRRGQRDECGNGAAVDRIRSLLSSP